MAPSENGEWRSNEDRHFPVAEGALIASLWLLATSDEEEEDRAQAHSQEGIVFAGSLPSRQLLGKLLLLGE